MRSLAVFMLFALAGCVAQAAASARQAGPAWRPPPGASLDSGHRLPNVGDR